MLHYLCVVLSASLCFVGGAVPKTASLPKEFKTCSRGDDVCLKDAITAALPYYRQGIPKLGVLPIDPLRITEIKIDQGSGPVQLNLDLTDQDLVGITRAQVKNVQTDLQDDSYLMNIEADFDTINVIGHYKASGKILILPIQGEGRNNLTLADVRAKITMKGHVQDGFVILDTFDITFTSSRGYFHFDNLFNGDKALGDNMNQFLTDNWKVVLDELKPAIQEAFGTVFKEVVRRTYIKVPYNNIHPKP